MFKEARASIDDKYWKKKVKKAVEISKEFGYSEQNENFWNNQRAGIISLLIDIYDKLSCKQ